MLFSGTIAENIAYLVSNEQINVAHFFVHILAENIAYLDNALGLLFHKIFSGTSQRVRDKYWTHKWRSEATYPI